MARDGVQGQVVGLREIRRNLISADKKFGPEIRKVLKQTAEIVAADARSRVPLGPPLAGHAKNTIKPGTSGAKAIIRAGTKKSPYYGWLDFGGSRDMTRKTAAGHTTDSKQKKKLRRSGSSFEDSRPFLEDGRYIYPAIRDRFPDAVKFLQKEIKRLIEKGAPN